VGHDASPDCRSCRHARKLGHFAVLIGCLWFKEGRLRPGLLAAVLVAVGVVLIKL